MDNMVKKFNKIIVLACIALGNTSVFANNECVLQGQLTHKKTPVQVCLDFSLWSKETSLIEPLVWGTIQFKDQTFRIPKTPLFEPFDVDCDGLFTIHFEASKMSYGYDNWPRAKLKYGERLNLITTIFDKNLTLDDVTIGNVDEYLEVAIVGSEKVKFQLTEKYVSPVHYMGDPVQKLGSNVVQEASVVQQTK